MNDDYLLRILLVDDEEIVHMTLGPYLRDCGHQVDSAGEGTTALRLIEENDYELVLIDIRMPDLNGLSVLARIEEIHPELPAVIITGHGNMENVIQALRMGAADFLTKPIKLLELDTVVEKSIRLRHLRQGQRRLRETIKGIHTSEDIRFRNRYLVGISKATKDVKHQIKLASQSQAQNILILGEAGTGKEIVAREIHFMSGGEDKPFIVVNCPALEEPILETELFGQDKVFATDPGKGKTGYFELAEGGSIFLDEIADLSSSIKGKLNRVLETRKLRRVGGGRGIAVNVRFMAATTTPQEELIGVDGFCKEVFSRLNVFTIKLLPLRERREDIMPLAEHFLSTYLSGRGLGHIQGFSEEAKTRLINYDFPGNGRELNHIVERAAILCRSSLIGPEHLHLSG